MLLPLRRGQGRGVQGHRATDQKAGGALREEEVNFLCYWKVRLITFEQL